MKAVLYFGPESPADLWWSQGAKNTRKQDEQPMENGLPKGDTTPFANECVKGTLKSDTIMTQKVNFEEMKNYSYNTIKPLKKTGAVVKEEPKDLVNGPPDGETKLQDLEPVIETLEGHRNEIISYRQPKQEAATAALENKKLPPSLKKPSGCERRKRKGYVPKHSSSNNHNICEIQERVRNLDIHFPKLPSEEGTIDESSASGRKTSISSNKYSHKRSRSSRYHMESKVNNLDLHFLKLPNKDRVVNESSANGRKISDSYNNCSPRRTRSSNYYRVRNLDIHFPKLPSKGGTIDESSASDQKPSVSNNDHSPKRFRRSRYHSPTSANFRNTHPESSRKRAYSDIVKNKLDVVIVNEDHPEGMLTPEQSDFVIDQLVSALVDYPSTSSDNIPRFERYDFVKGILTITCVDEISLAWIHTLPFTDILENAKLKIMRASEFARLIRMTAFIPGPVRENADILKLLKAQNKELNTHRWRIYHRSEVASGISLILGVDDLSVEVLKSLELQPFYGIGRAEFYLPKDNSRKYSKFKIRNS